MLIRMQTFLLQCLLPLHADGGDDNYDIDDDGSDNDKDITTDARQTTGDRREYKMNILLLLQELSSIFYGC